MVTDGGGEFQGAFADLLLEALVDHRVTSASHPQADGLAERAVQTVKRALRKVCQLQGHADEWDLAVPWIKLGYNCSVQASTKFSPYELLYTHPPLVPPATAERLLEPLSLNEEDAAATLVQRGQLLRERALVAGANLRVAQHRDTLRYAQVRSGGYPPKLRKFEVGDYVYVKRPNPASTLHMKAHPHILRVLQV